VLEKLNFSEIFGLEKLEIFGSEKLNFSDIRCMAAEKEKLE
jgi:hypothetical protein